METLHLRLQGMSCASVVVQYAESQIVEKPLPEAENFEAIAGIGAEVWLFLLKKPQTKQAQLQAGIQELTVTVDGGYEPNYIVVEAGQPVRLNFFRRDANSCLDEVLLPDFGIATNLPLNTPTSVEFTPQKPGEYQFTCGMRMFRGVVELKEPASVSK